MVDIWSGLVASAAAVLPASIRSRPARAAVAAVVAFVAVLIAAGVTLAVQGRSDESAPTAVVEVAGRVYPFSPRTCVIVEDSFVVSGPGTSDGERFVASITKAGGLELAFGVASDVERPLADRPWWLSGAIDDYRIDGRSVQAAVQVEDLTGSVDGKQPASVRARCPATG